MQWMQVPGDGSACGYFDYRAGQGPLRGPRMERDLYAGAMLATQEELEYVTCNREEERGMARMALANLSAKTRGAEDPRKH